MFEDQDKVGEELRESGFVLDSRSKVEWALRKIAAKEAEIELVTAQAQEMIKGLNTDLERLQAHFRPQIEHWAKQELEETKAKGRTVKTLAGNLSFRTVPPRLVIADEEEAMRRARADCPEAIVIVPATVKIDKKVLGDYAKAQLADAGEIIEGYMLVEATESFSIKFAGKDGGQDA